MVTIYTTLLNVRTLPYITPTFYIQVLCIVFRKESGFFAQHAGLLLPVRYEPNF